MPFWIAFDQQKQVRPFGEPTDYGNNSLGKCSSSADSFPLIERSRTSSLKQHSLPFADWDQDKQTNEINPSTSIVYFPPAIITVIVGRAGENASRKWSMSSSQSEGREDKPPIVLRKKEIFLSSCRAMRVDCMKKKWVLFMGAMPIVSWTLLTDWLFHYLIFIFINHVRFEWSENTKQRQAKLQLKDELENKTSESQRKKEWWTQQQGKNTFISLQRTDIDVTVIVFIVSSEVITRRVIDQTQSIGWNKLMRTMVIRRRSTFGHWWKATWCWWATFARVRTFEWHRRRWFNMT